MYDKQKPRELEIAPELSALERQLRGMTPAAPRVDRDRLMFTAGQAAVSADAGQHGRAMYDRAGDPHHIAGPSWAAYRFWPTATFTMTAATLLLATMLVWQRQTNQFASKGDASPPSTNQASEQPLMAITPPPGEPATSSVRSPTFQHPSSGYLGIRYAALTRGVSAWQPSSQASAGAGGSYDDTPRTLRKMLEEFLPSPIHQINPSF
jgi:hypothetical protein